MNLIADATMRAATFLETFVEWPPSQLPASFSVDQVEERVNEQIREKLQSAPAPAQ